LINEIDSIINDNNFSNLDDNHLLPQDVLKLSQHLSLPVEYFYDYYYKFVFSNCSSMLRTWRNKNKANIKRAASILAVSPTDLSKWENGKDYPTRKQYSKIVKLL
jgi:DNA-binding XRE family transcriptional regulator